MRMCVVEFPYLNCCIHVMNYKAVPSSRHHSFIARWDIEASARKCKQLATWKLWCNFIYNILPSPRKKYMCDVIRTVDWKILCPGLAPLGSGRQCSWRQSHLPKPTRWATKIGVQLPFFTVTTTIVRVHENLISSYQPLLGAYQA
jgi:hypothetical protein